MHKHYISAQQLLEDSFKLAWQVYESGYRPNYIVGVWRGGAPVGIAVQELLDVLGVEADHIAIRTSSYTGIGQRSRHVKVHGLTYIIKQLESEDSLLIVDDVHDTGLSIDQVVQDLQQACKKNTPEIRIATPYYKPGNNKTTRVPEYYIHETAEWLVFPHELHGLSIEELRRHKPELASIMAPLEQHLSASGR
ncbi:MAG: phosphoribosyltransferase family protein [Haliea sp.]|nr:phosphoribosyltransferase family protein [Haliea sp.]